MCLCVWWNRQPAGTYRLLQDSAEINKLSYFTHVHHSWCFEIIININAAVTISWKRNILLFFCTAFDNKLGTVLIFTKTLNIIIFHSSVIYLSPFTNLHLSGVLRSLQLVTLHKGHSLHNDITFSHRYLMLINGWWSYNQVFIYFIHDKTPKLCHTGIAVTEGLCCSPSPHDAGTSKAASILQP